jgi:HEAT repeat protein
MRWGAYLLLVVAWSLPAVTARAQPEPSTGSLLGGPREGAARGLRDRLTGPRLARELASASVSARMRAAAGLGRWGAPGPAVDALIDSLAREPTAPVRTAIARALVRRGDPRAVGALVTALRGAGGADEEALLEALGAFATGEALEALVAATSEPRLRRPATEALVRVGPRAVPYLVDRLRDAEAPLPLLEALGAVGSPVATAALLDQLASPEPLVRVAALRALERIGDPRAARAVLAALSDDSVVVQRAAISALGAVGSANDAARLEPLLTGTVISDLGVWEAMLALDPERASVGLLGALGGVTERALAPREASTERALAPGEASESLPPGLVRLVLGHPCPALLPVFERFVALPGFATGPYASELLEALGTIPDERAVRLLARTSAEHPELAARTAASLGLALFRFGPRFGDDTRDAALASILQVPSEPERLILRALARDPSAPRALGAALAGDDVTLRWAAAFALATTDGPCPAEALVATAREADDPELFRRLAEAALRCRVEAEPAVYRRFLHDPEAAPEARVWAALSLRDAGPGPRAELGRSLRVALRREDARGRAGAARALAELGDRGAYRALLGALEDREPAVRRAAARALEVLAVPEAAATLEAIARTEADPFLRAALLDAARASAGGDAPARFARPGVEVYRAPALGLSEATAARIDLALADGTYRRFVAPWGGALAGQGQFEPLERFFVAGLPYGPVQARIQVQAGEVGP